MIPSTPAGVAPSERSLNIRRRFLLMGWVAVGLFLLLRAAELQVMEGSEWRAEAERQHRMQGQVVAPRGSILDRDGTPLALSHETFRVSVAPHELADRDAGAELLARTLSLSQAEARRIAGSTRRWIPLPGRYPPSIREALASAQGIYVERELRRFHPHDQLVTGVLGVVIDEVGTGGIEQAFEEHLRGTPGLEILARDSRGRPIPGETWLVDAPRSGGQVVLTLDADLQEIAQEALREAVETTGARGGDLIVTDPRTGEVLAMVSLLDGRTDRLGAINTPYEPGSTLKPFTVAALLQAGRATLADSVDTGNGRWQSHGRTITDVSVIGHTTLAHALQQSSNVAVAMLAERMTPAEQYESLRDFGFGVSTGLPLPGEVGGTLRRPQQWSRQSSASLAMGYEISVTPLQMAMAYGALANGGVLMEPRLVRELRDADGRILERYEPRAVRQVVDSVVAAEISGALVQAVEEGTGTRARLGTFQVAGKSGTSRAFAANGGYERGGYYSSFVGFFPAERPQLVVFVKLDRPQGAYYGGATAAPVTRATMEAVLAARKPPLDRGALTAIARSQQVNPVTRGVETPATRPLFTALSRESGSPIVAPVPPVEPGMAFPLPDIRGLSPRQTARRLHSLGLTVVWEATGPGQVTRPRMGSTVHPGDTVRVYSGPPGDAVPASVRVQNE